MSKYIVDVYKYMRVSTKEQEYDYQLDIINNSYGRLVSALKDDMIIGDMIEIREKKSASNEDIIRRGFNELTSKIKERSKDKNRLAVIIVSDHTRFCRGLFNSLKLIVDLISITKSDDKYSRVVIDFGYDGLSIGDFTFTNCKTKIGQNVMLLSGISFAEELNHNAKVARTKAGLKQYLESGGSLTENRGRFTNKFMYKLLSNPSLVKLPMRVMLAHLPCHNMARQTVYIRSLEIFGIKFSELKSILMEQEEISRELINAVWEFENSKKGDIGWNTEQALEYLKTGSNPIESPDDIGSQLQYWINNSMYRYS